MNLDQFDLSDNDGAVMELRDPRGEPIMKSDGKTPVTITVMSFDADPMIKARNAALNSASRRRGQATAESVQADTIRLYAKATKGWDGVGIGEDETPFSVENAIRLYTKFPFIREQVDAFISDRANFFKDEPTS